MALRPTVIVTAVHLHTSEHGTDAAEPALDAGAAFSLTLQHAVATMLPVVVVTTPLLAGLACATVAARDVVVADEAAPVQAGQGRAIAQGVWARPDSPGWLVLPGDMPILGASTICAVASALEEHAVAYAQHLGRPGYPVGFAAELYSELVTSTDKGLVRRMMARYPAHAVDVEDAGAIVTFRDQEEMENLRSVGERHRALRARS